DPQERRLIARALARPPRVEERARGDRAAGLAEATLDEHVEDAAHRSVAREVLALPRRLADPTRVGPDRPAWRVLVVIAPTHAARAGDRLGDRRIDPRVDRRPLRALDLRLVAPPFEIRKAHAIDRFAPKTPARAMRLRG